MKKVSAKNYGKTIESSTQSQHPVLIFKPTNVENSIRGYKEPEPVASEIRKFIITEFQKLKKK